MRKITVKKANRKTARITTYSLFSLQIVNFFGSNLYTISKSTPIINVTIVTIHRNENIFQMSASVMLFRLIRLNNMGARIVSINNTADMQKNSLLFS